MIFKNIIDELFQGTPKDKSDLEKNQFMFVYNFTFKTFENLLHF